MERQSAHSPGRAHGTLRTNSGAAVTVPASPAERQSGAGERGGSQGKGEKAYRKCRRYVGLAA